MLRKFFKTGKGCPIYQIYFESGHLPARYQIKRMKIVFYRYILKQKRKLTVISVFHGQKMEPKRGDWYSEIVKIMNEFDITLSENKIKVLPASIFKKIVKNKAVSAGIEYLKTKQMKCEKGARIKYSTLELQDY